MNFILTARFKKAFKSLPQDTQVQVKEALRRLSEDIRYPSLRTKKIQGTKDIWEARVSLDCRRTFQFMQNYVILRNVGRHAPTLKNP